MAHFQIKFSTIILDVWKHFIHLFILPFVPGFLFKSLAQFYYLFYYYLLLFTIYLLLLLFTIILLLLNNYCGK